jgi:hypothetical protein
MDQEKLEAMARAGDAAAQFDLGLSLIRGPAAPQWPRAVELLQAASRNGYGPATERCAVFACMGVGGPANWAQCIVLLRQAAEQGSQSARRQLAILTADGVPVEQKLRPPAARNLSATPLIRVVETLASPAECEWLIEPASARLEPAYVFNSQGGTLGVDPARSNRSAVFGLADIDCVLHMVRVRIAAAIGIPVECFEWPQVLHYAVGQEFRPHHDFLDPASDLFRAELARNGQRIATALVYLNDGFEGGDTRFPSLDLAFRGGTGDALIFTNVDPRGQPDRSTLHAGMPPTSGEKWLLSQWIREHPPGAGRG